MSAPLTDRPQPGYWMMRMVSGGPPTAVRIAYGPASDPVTGERLDRSWLWSAWINGEPLAEASPDPIKAGVYRIWHARKDPCSAADYQHHVATILPWAIAHGAPEARPYEAMDLTKLPPIKRRAP